MSVPSIKGIVLQPTCDQLNALVAHGRLSREQLEIRLEPADLEVLDSKIEPSLWYARTTADRLSAALVDAAGGGDPEWLKEQGRDTVEAVLARDVLRDFIQSAVERSDRVGETLVGLGSLIQNFGSWSYSGEELTDCQVELRDCGDSYSDLACWSAAGFMEGLIRKITGESVTVSFSRPSAGHVVYRVHPD
ncbi:MAG: hypothetical protein MJE66_22145 [Proteobacteria bacterium]|nr:hypothetical protein [Pseudomonadota bacterium]